MTNDRSETYVANRESEWVPVPPSVQVGFQRGQMPAIQRRSDLVTRCYELRGPVEIERLRVAIQSVWAAHDALRLRFVLHDGIGFMASVRADDGVPLKLQQAVNLAEQDVPRAIAVLGDRVAERWYKDDSTSARWLLLRLNPERHILVGWYAGLAIDVKGITVVERQIWESYFSPSAAIEGSSFIAAARTRSTARERNPRGHWDVELARVTPQRWDPADITVVRTVSRDLSTEQFEVLRGSTADMGLSLTQLLAHRFAACAYEANGQGPTVIQHFLDDRSASEQGAVGDFVLSLPLVVGVEEVVSARASARATMRAFALRPRRAGTRLPDGLVGLYSAARPYSFNYVPAHYGRSVEPNGVLVVTEYELGESIRHVSPLDLQVSENLEGGLRVRLAYHPEECDDRLAERLLSGLLDSTG